jgi:hypothetical protein
VHAILTYNGKNLLTKQTIPCETDELTHVYTLIIHPNNTYAVLIDNEQKESGRAVTSVLVSPKYPSLSLLYFYSFFSRAPFSCSSDDDT